MKRCFWILLAVAAVASLVTISCAMAEDYGGIYIENQKHSDCLQYTDSIAAKDMTGDSIVVTLHEGRLFVSHHGMLLDCKSIDQVRTWAEMDWLGDTLFVTENLGPQGWANCICQYDYSYEISTSSLPLPFTLVITQISDFFGHIDSARVYQYTFNRPELINPGVI